MFTLEQTIPGFPDPGPHSTHLLMSCLVPVPWGLCGRLAGFLLETDVDRPHFGGGVRAKNQENIGKRSLGVPGHVLGAELQCQESGSRRSRK